MDTDLAAVHLTATGQVMPGPARLRGLHCIGTATAGTILLSDSLTGAGVTRFFINTPASAAVAFDLPFQTNGIRFTTGMYATLTNVTGVTFLVDGIGPLPEQLAFYNPANSDFIALL